MLKYSCFLWLSAFAAWGADGYITTHVFQHPEAVKEFIQHLPRRESLLWQAWLHLQQQDYDQANNCYTALAELDDPQGYRGLADSYLAGHGFAQNTELALVLYEKAAKLGHGAAQINAASLRADRREWSEAERWFQQALNNPDTKDMKDALQELHHRRMQEKA